MIDKCAMHESAKVKRKEYSHVLELVFLKSHGSGFSKHCLINKYEMKVNESQRNIKRKNLVITSNCKKLQWMQASLLPLVEGNDVLVKLAESGVIS